MGDIHKLIPLRKHTSVLVELLIADILELSVRHLIGIVMLVGFSYYINGQQLQLDSY